MIRENWKFASQQKTDVDNDPEVAVVAQELEKIFANGVSQENLNRYVLKNFSNKELTVAEAAQKRAIRRRYKGRALKLLNS